MILDVAIEEKILDMIINITDEEEIRENLDINLFENDILDSLGYTELLVSIAMEFGIELSPTEITRDMIDTPKKIIELIRSRRSNNEKNIC